MTSKNVNIIKTLCENGANIMTKDDNGETAILTGWYNV